MIQIILTIAVIALMGWFLSNHASQQVRAWQKMGMIALTTVGLVVIIFPNTSNDAAQVLGVGRGADLLLYLLSLAFIFTVLNLYLKGKEDQKRTVILARRVALLEARLQSGRKGE